MLLLNFISSQRYAAALLACLLATFPAFAADQVNSPTATVADIAQPASEPGSRTVAGDRAPAAADNPATEEVPAAAQTDSGTSTSQPIAPAGNMDEAAIETSANSPDIKAFQLEGNALIDAASIKQHLSSFLGLEKTSTNLFKVKQELFKFYRSSGLGGVAIANPEVTTDGIVVIKIFEDEIKTAKAIRLRAAAAATAQSESEQQQLVEEAAQITQQAEMTTPKQQREPETTAKAEIKDLKSGKTAVTPEAATQPKTTAKSAAQIPEAKVTKQSAVNHVVPQNAPEQRDSEKAAADTALIAEKADVSATGQTTPLPAPPAWLADGWQQLEAGNTDAAMATWQKEVDKMPGYRYLAFIGVYRNLKTAVEILKKAGIEHHAIMLTAMRDDKMAYYVLSAQETSYDKQQRQNELASLRQRMGIDYMYASAAKRFQGETPTAIEPPETVATVQPETSKPALQETSELKAAPKTAESVPATVEKETLPPVAKKEPHTSPEKKPAAAAKEPEPVKEVVKLQEGKITGFEIYGNSLISDKAMQDKLQPYLGENKTSADLEQARVILTRMYQSRGYPLVAVSMPEQVKGEIIPVRIYEVSGTKRAVR